MKKSKTSPERQLIPVLLALLLCLSGCVVFEPVPAGKIEAIGDPEADSYNTAIIDYNSGVAKLAENDFTGAAEFFKKALKSFPGFFEASLDLGLVYDIFLEQPDRAVEIYRRLLETRPKDTRLIRLLPREEKVPGRTPEKPGEEKKSGDSEPAETRSGALIRANSALARGEYGLAGREFQEALEEELSLKEETLALRGLGIAYAALEFDKPAREAFEQALYRNPQAELPPKTYPDRVYKIYSEVRLKYPAPLELKATTASALALVEEAVFEFTVTVPCELEIRITPLGETDVLFKKTVKVKKEALQDSIKWLAGSSPGFELRPRTYRIELTAKGEGDWSWTRGYPLRLTGNFDTDEVREVAHKEDRYRALQGQLHLTHIPGEKRWELVEKPKQFSWKGFMSYPYYGTVGAIRDGIDFPVKFLYSVPGLGHALTIAHPFIVYVAAEAAQDVDKDDYQSLFWGPLSDANDRYKSDKRAAQGNAALAGIASLVAFPAVMSVLSWAGTDDGVSKGFYSYYRSNAFGEGYKPEYFFPNWRSMDFTVIRDDPEEEKRLLAEAKKKNAALNERIGERNARINDFNMETFSKWRFDLLKGARKSLEQILKVDFGLGKPTDILPWEKE